VDDAADTAWVGKREAARVLGLSADGVRKRASRGLIESRKANDGTLRYLITAGMVEAARSRPRMSADTSAAVAGHSAGPTAAGPGQSADTALLVENARLAERLAAEARRSTDLLGVITDLRADRDRLAAELALARKGWLERLIEAVRKR
jgi:hypothetical protein